MRQNDQCSSTGTSVDISSKLLDRLEQKLGYKFKNRDFLIQALVHRSYSNEKNTRKIEDNERLEFLGDAALELAISDIMFHEFPHYTEGELSKLRALIVNERQLSKLAEELELGKAILLGKGEELTGGRTKPSVLADCMEAVLAAVYLDGGYRELREVVNRLFSGLFMGSKSPLEVLNRDFKTRLQEYTQNEYKETPTYELEKETGPDHDKTFYVSVLVGDKKVGFGVGKSKKAAEQKAAEEALEVLLKEKESK